MFHTALNKLFFQKINFGKLSKNEKHLILSFCYNAEDIKQIYKLNIHITLLFKIIRMLKNAENYKFYEFYFLLILFLSAFLLRTNEH